MRKLIIAAAFALAASSTQAVQGDNECLYGTWAASQAYTLTVYDAKNPDYRAAARMLDFRLSQMPFPASKEYGEYALAYIGERLRKALIRAPQDWQVSWAAEEFIKQACMQ